MIRDRMTMLFSRANIIAGRHNFSPVADVTRIETRGSD